MGTRKWNTKSSPLSVVFFTAYTNSLIQSIENYPGIDYIGIYADNIFAVRSGNPSEVSWNLNTFTRKT